MKRLVALGAALMVLLFGFAANVEVSPVENGGIQVCEDIMPPGNPFD